MNKSRYFYKNKAISKIKIFNGIDTIYKNNILKKYKHFYIVETSEIKKIEKKHYDIDKFIKSKTFKNLEISEKQIKEIENLLFYINNYNEFFDIRIIKTFLENNIETNYLKRLRLLNNLKCSTSLYGLILKYGISSAIEKFNNLNFIKNNPAKNHNGKLAPFSKNFIKYIDIDESEKINKIKNIIQNKKITNATYNTRLSYYLEHGYTMDEAIKKLKDRQNTFSYNKCIEKFGIEKGLKIFNERQTKWQNTLKNKPEETIKEINIKKGTGFLNKLYMKNDIVKKINGLLYFIKFYNNEISFYKIGITTKTINERFRRYISQSNLKYEIILLKNDYFYNCYKTEQKILNCCKSCKISINYKKFKTHEAFNRNISNEIKHFFK